MKVYKALNTEYLHNKVFHMNSIILKLDNGTIFVCNKFNHPHKYNLELIVWLPHEKKWFRTYAKNQYTEMMWDYYRKHKPKTSHDFKKYENMMKHSRKHKSGGSGIRLKKENYYARKTFTDYECSNNPLHDFRRYYN